MGMVLPFFSRGEERKSSSPMERLMMALPSCLARLGWACMSMNMVGLIVETAWRATLLSELLYFLLLYSCTLLKRFLNLSHHPQEVLSPDAMDVGFAVSFGEELTGEVDKF